MEYESPTTTTGLRTTTPCNILVTKQRSASTCSRQYGFHDGWINREKSDPGKAGDGERQAESKSLLDMKDSQLPDAGITIVGGILVPGPDKGNLWFEW